MDQEGANMVIIFFKHREQFKKLFNCFALFQRVHKKLIMCFMWNLLSLYNCFLTYNFM